MWTSVGLGKVLEKVEKCDHGVKVIRQEEVG
jgi:hypothetical protein